MRELFQDKEESVGFDFTNYDRTLHASLIHGYFHKYLPGCVLGLPLALQDAFHSNICHSWLLSGTGQTFQKHRGNPSGMPNTIRLNSVCQLAGQTYCLEKLGVADQVKMVVCGDDSLFGVSSPVADLLVAQLPKQLADEFGMTLGLEARVPLNGDLTMHAPFVSRTTVLIGGIPYGVLTKPHKLMATVLFNEDPGDIHDLLVADNIYASRVQGVFDALAHHVFAMEEGLYTEPYTKEIMRLFNLDSSDLQVRLH